MQSVEPGLDAHIATRSGVVWVRLHRSVLSLGFYSSGASVASAPTGPDTTFYASVSEDEVFVASASGLGQREDFEYFSGLFDECEAAIR